MCIGNPGLRASDNVLVAVLDGGRLGSSGITSISGLGQSKAADLLTGVRCHVLFLDGGRAERHGIQVERVVGAHDDSDAGATTRDLLHGNGVRHGVEF